VIYFSVHLHHRKCGLRLCISPLAETQTSSRHDYRRLLNVMLAFVISDVCKTKHGFGAWVTRTSGSKDPRTRNIARDTAGCETDLFHVGWTRDSCVSNATAAEIMTGQSRLPSTRNTNKASPPLSIPSIDFKVPHQDHLDLRTLADS